MNCKTSHFPALWLLKGISWLQDEACMAADVLAVDSIFPAHYSCPFPTRSMKTLKCWVSCQKISEVSQALTRAYDQDVFDSAQLFPQSSTLCWLGKIMTREIVTEKSLSSILLSAFHVHTDTSLFSARSLQPTRYWTWVNWTSLRIAQLSGCLNGSCYSAWQGTSGLATCLYYICLTVPSYYVSHLEDAVQLQRSYSSWEAAQKDWVFTV